MAGWNHHSLHRLLLDGLALAACTEPHSPTPVSHPQTQSPSGSPSPSPYPDLLAGTYTATVTLGSSCAVLPEVERTRTYTARIEKVPQPGLYVGTLGGATFLTGPICTAGYRHFAGVGCHQFFASEDIDIANFFLENNNDEVHGGHVVERLSNGGWVEIIGGASGPMQTANAVVSSMTAHGKADV